jgi:hypothetical protein
MEKTMATRGEAQIEQRRLGFVSEFVQTELLSQQGRGELGLKKSRPQLKNDGA